MARGVFTGGNDVSSSELNDAFAPPHCRIRNTGAAQSIPNNSSTALTFNTDTEDVGGCHDTAVNTSRITAPAGGDGWWGFMTNVEFPANATGHRQLSLRVNGSVFIASTSDPTPSGTNVTRLQVSTEYRLAVGDYVEAIVYQNSGGALNANVGNEYTPVAVGRWICP